MSSGEQAAMTNTRHGAPADAARVLRRSWPHLPWTDVRIARGAFHHVLLLPPRAVIRVRNGAEHAPCHGPGSDDSDHPVLGWVGIPGPAGRSGAQEAMVGGRLRVRRGSGLHGPTLVRGPACAPRP